MLSANISQIKIKIERLLNEAKCESGKHTHVSLGGNLFPGKFNFEDNKKRDKLIKYLSLAFDENVNFSIAEKLKLYGPILIDIDMRLPIETNPIGRLYTDELITNIIGKYREVINKYLKVNDHEMTCIVFEKFAPSEKNNEKCDGVHIIFPHIVAIDKIRHLIFKDVNTMCNDEELFSEYSNSSNVLDSMVVSTNPWLMYGCSKPGSNPYKVSKIYDKNNNVLDNSTLGSTRDVINLLSMYNKKNTELNATKYMENINDSYIDTIETNIKKTDDITQGDTLALIDKSIKLVQMLLPNRASDYNNWLRVGWSLHNTHRSLIDTWIDFSKTSSKYKQGECEKMWGNMKDDGYTMRSLMLWAKEDNPEEYSKFINDEFENNLKKKTSINNTFMIAKALYSKYFDKFVCANPKDNTWYHFVEHRWRKCVNGGKLITLISSEFANHYISISAKFNKKFTDSTNDDERSKQLDNIKHYQKIAENLMDITFKKKIMEEAKNIFHDENFIKRLDENPLLIGFENGVYDLARREFRIGYPDDHISMSTKVDYVKWSDKNPYASPIKNFFKQILPNDNVREYFLSRLSTCVSGENREEKAYFATGTGSNGKSLTFQLVSEALGDYYISCPITIITRKRNQSNAASPELARLKGPRCGVFQEPGSEEELNIGIFKELTGNDKFMVRGLYQEPIEVKPQIKYWLTCNELPEIKSDDGGTWRRIRVIDFSSKFVDNPDPLNPNEFQLDDKLKGQISAWAPIFASYLIHIYITKYDVADRVVEPLEVQLSTNKYRKEQDIVREYYDNLLEITLDKTDTIKKKDLFIHFKMWFGEIHQGETLPKSKKIYDFMDKEIKHKYNAAGWPYIRFKKDLENSKTTKNELDI